jgi:hypothetical protein
MNNCLFALSFKSKSDCHLNFSSLLNRLKSVSVVLVLSFSVSAVSNAASFSICLITRERNNPLTAQLIDGAQSSAHELDVDLDVHSSNDPNHQSASISYCVAQQVKGIIVDAADSDSVSVPLRDARAAGVLVVSVGKQFLDSESIDANIMSDGLSSVDVASTWANANNHINHRNSKLLLSESLLGLGTSTAINERISEFATGQNFDLSQTENLDTASSPDKNVSTFRFSDPLKAYESAKNNDIELGAIFVRPATNFADLSRQLKLDSKSDKFPIVVFDAGCHDLASLTNDTVSVAIQDNWRNMGILGLKAVHDFTTSGKKPILSEGKTFIDAGVVVAFSKPELEMPNPLCKINPKLCVVQPMLMSEYLKTTCE